MICWNLHIEMVLAEIISFVMEILREALLIMIKFCGKLIQFFGYEVLEILKRNGGEVLLTLENFTWLVKNFCGQLMNWFHLALPFLIIAVILAIFLYFFYFRIGILFSIMDHLKIACVMMIKIVKNLFIYCWKSVKDLFIYCERSSKKTYYHDDEIYIYIFMLLEKQKTY